MSEQETQQPASVEGERKTERQQSDPRGSSSSSGRERSRGRRRHGGGSGGNAPSRSSEHSLNMDELRELVELINEYGFTDFELENQDVRVRLRRELAPQIISAQPSVQASAAPAQQPDATLAQTAQAASSASNRTATPAAPTAPAETDAAAEDEDLTPIPSPIVGTFYRSPSPTAEPFVRLGSQVTPDMTVCIIEAMKLMNEIQAETTGVIAKIYVENGQPVEYGQPLFGIKK
jgi:acetyl-CoA carboxylase, biotin carboxyl carrier protein